MRFFDRAGHPIDETAWAALHRDPAYTRVAHSAIAPGIEVSTVWLGLDHNPGGQAPHIFETMIFGGALDSEQRRYSSEAGARAGHDEAVFLARAELELGGAPHPSTQKPAPDEAG